MKRTPTRARNGKAKKSIRRTIRRAAGSKGLEVARALRILELQDKDLRPSVTHDRPWLHVFRRTKGYPKDTPRSGKCLVFVRRDEVDTAWLHVRDATIAGELGSCAKVATAMPNQFNASGTHVICVYTYDADDAADVGRVRKGLRALGFVKNIPYKTDAATREGTYS